MKTCLVFAISIFDLSKLYVLREYLDTFKSEFNDCDFYIGINYNSIPEVENVIDEYSLKVQTIRVVREELYCGSDASAYQAALALLKASNQNYDLYWFAHTKGAVNHRPVERSMYLTQLFGQRREIENLFTHYSKLGSYALRGVSRSAANDNWATFNRDHYVKICSNEKHGAFQYTHVNWSYIETMYVIRGEVIQAFLKALPGEYYTTRIQEPCYFEVILPWAVSRYGYFPYIKQKECFWGGINLNKITAYWLRENNLEELDSYLLI